MSCEKAVAIVIRLVEFSESSYVATLFTDEFGKLTGLAKGARRAKSAFENALDLLAVSRVVFLRRSSDAMDLLTEAKLERRFRAASRDLNRMNAGFYVAELLNALTDERDPQPDLFRRARGTLEALDDSGDVASEVLRFELASLRILGHWPAVDRCVECGQILSGGTRHAFGLLAGGTLCVRCKVGQRHVISVSPVAVETLREFSDVKKGNQGGAATIPTSVRGELRGLMNQRMSHLLGRRPRMHSFLATLR